MIKMNTKELTILICVICIIFLSELIIIFKIYDRQTQILHKIENIKMYNFNIDQ